MNWLDKTHLHIIYQCLYKNTFVGLFIVDLFMPYFLDWGVLLNVYMITMYLLECCVLFNVQITYLDPEIVKPNRVIFFIYLSYRVVILKWSNSVLAIYLVTRIFNATIFTWWIYIVQYTYSTLYTNLFHVVKYRHVQGVNISLICVVRFTNAHDIFTRLRGSVFGNKSHSWITILNEPM